MTEIGIINNWSERIRFLASVVLLICVLIPCVQASASDTSNFYFGTAPLRAHDLTSRHYDVVYYASLPWYVLAKDYVADEASANQGILMLTQYVYNCGQQWMAYRPNRNGVLPESDLPIFLNSGFYGGSITNCAVFYGENYPFIQRDFSFNSYFLRRETNVPVEGVKEYFLRVEECATPVILTEEDWATGVWYEEKGGKLSLCNGAFDPSKVYYRDDSSYTYAANPEWESGQTYSYFVPETRTASKLKATYTDVLIGGMYYVGKSITSHSTFSWTSGHRNRAIVSGKYATVSANSFSSQHAIKSAELAALIPVVKAPGNYAATTWNTRSTTRAEMTYYDPLINGDYFFSLSAGEVLSFFADAADGRSTYNGAKTNLAHWQMRSFNLRMAQSCYFYSANESTSTTNPRPVYYIASTYPELSKIGVRPAMVLNPAKVVFLSDASTTTSGKQGINGTFNSSTWAPLYDSNTDVWKPTLLDDSMSVSFSLGKAVLNKTTRVVTIPYSGANSNHTGWHYISGILPGGYYTRFARFVPPKNKSGVVKVVLPKFVDLDSGRLAIFLERVNGMKETDFSTEPEIVRLSRIESVGEPELSELDFTATGGSFVYDGAAHTVTVDGVNGAALSYSVDGKNYTSEVPTVRTVAEGSLTIWVKAELSGYKSTVRKATVEITPRNVSVSWPSETRFAYDGLVHSVIPTLVNAVVGDDVGPEFIGASERAPGSYTASVTGLTGADRGNYTISPDSVNWFIYDGVTEKKTLKILFIGNSLSQDARMKLPDAAALIPFLADADVEFGSLYQGGRSLGYFANCARVEKGESEFNLRYYLFTNATERSKPSLFTAEQKEKFGVVNNGYGNPYFNFCEYWKWDKAKRAWVCEKNADNLGEKTIEYAMSQNKWDLVVLQGFYCDFFGEEYDAINPKTTFKAAAAKECIQDNLTYLCNYLTELQPDVKLAFYIPPAHNENSSWKGSLDSMYKDMMERRRDIENWNLVDFFIPGATILENVTTTYLGNATYDDSKNRDDVLPRLRRDAIHSSYYMGRFLQSTILLDYATRYFYGNAPLVDCVPFGELKSPAIGALPTEYADICRAALTTTQAQPYQVTDLNQAPYSFPKEDPATLAYNAAKSYKEENENAASDACVAAARSALSASEAADLTVERTIDEAGETITFKFGYTTSESIQFPLAPSGEE